MEKCDLRKIGSKFILILHFLIPFLLILQTILGVVGSSKSLELANPFLYQVHMVNITIIECLGISYVGILGTILGGLQSMVILKIIISLFVIAYLFAGVGLLKNKSYGKTIAKTLSVFGLIAGVIYFALFVILPFFSSGVAFLSNFSDPLFMYYFISLFVGVIVQGGIFYYLKD